MSFSATEFKYTVTSGATNYFTFNGTFGTSSNTGAFGGSFTSSTTLNDSYTINWTGRHLYLVSVQTTSNVGIWTITTDGTITTAITPAQNAPTAGSNIYQVLFPLVRNLTDGAHTTTVQLTGGTGIGLFANSAIAITGTPPVPSSQFSYGAAGDSWTFGTGALNANLDYVSQVGRQLTLLAGQTVTVTNGGVSGCGYEVLNNSANNTPFFRQLLTTVLPANPYYLSLVGGINDIRQQQSGSGLSVTDFVFALNNTLTFLTDIFNTSAMNVVVSTPQYCTSYYQSQVLQSSGVSTGYSSGGRPAYEAAVQAARQVISTYPTIKMVDFYGIFNFNNDLLIPNSASDFGLHPNQGGHGVCASEILRGFLST